MTTAVLHVWGVRSVGPALWRVARGRRPLRRAHGLRFAKLLGTGSGDTFTARDADLHHWAALTVWDGPESAAAFESHPVVAAWDAAAGERLRVRMTPQSARGTWSGQRPLGDRVAARVDGPVAAITRARLRPTRALQFWRAVPPVSADLHGSDGLRLSLGIGEAPVGLQGTFSLWDSADDLVDFAYRRSPHVEAVRRTAEVRWYAEEMFARLGVVDVSGTYRGRRP